MSVLRRSTLMARCDICKLPFDPINGGVCKKCGRLLCSTHFHGGFLPRAASLLGFNLPCAQCRQKSGATEGARP
jgi:hypothetical protein